MYNLFNLLNFSEIRNVTETTNNLRQSVEKIQSRVVESREKQEENMNNITRLAANIEKLSLRLSKQLTEGRSHKLIIFKHTHNTPTHMLHMVGC